MFRRPLLALLCLAIPAITFLGSGTPASVAAQPRANPRVADVPELEGLAERWQTAIEQMGVPGMAVAIVKDGKVLALDGFGRRNPAGEPVTPETMFYIASMTKPFTAMGLCILADEGKLDLDAPVKRYLPDFQLADAEATERMTVRDLLCHRPALEDGAIVFLDAYSGQITDDVYYQRLRQVSPGDGPSYSNVHFTLAGRVIQAVSGQKWQDFLEKRIFEPVGMQRTTAYASRMYADGNHAAPMILLDGEMKPSPLQKTDRTMHAAGGMGSTAEDLARWLILNIQKGQIDGTRVVSEEMARQMQSIQAKLAEPDGEIRVMEGFGLGWQLGSYKRAHRPFLAHGGGYVGAASYMAVLPEKGLGVAVMANTGEAGAALCAMVMIDVFERLLESPEPIDLLPGYARRAQEAMLNSPRMPDGAPLGAAQLSAPPEVCAGTYRNDAWGTVEVTRAGNDGLQARIGDLAVHLYPPDARPAQPVPPRPRLGATFEADDAVGGMRVTVVTAGSPAEASGLKPGDVLTHIDGKPIPDTDALIAAVQGAAPDAVVKLTIQRDGQDNTLEARLPAPVELPAEQRPANHGPNAFYGWIAPGMDTPGRFVVEGDEAVAIELDIDDGKPVRFSRVQ